MITRFLVNNYRCFSDKTEFNMFTANNKFKRLKKHEIQVNDLRLVRNCAIFGKNSAGKTSLIKAIETLIYIILEGTEKRSSKLEYIPNKYADNLQRPTELALDFIFQGQEYTYIIKYNSTCIFEEILQFDPTHDGQIIFKRTSAEGEENNIEFNNSILYNSIGSNEELKFRNNALKEELRENQPLITELYNKKNKFISSIYDWIEDTFKFVFVHSEFKHIITNLYNSSNFKAKFIEIVQKADISIDDLNLKKRLLKEYLGVNDKELLDEIINNYNDDSGAMEVRFGNERFCVIKENEEYYHIELQIIRKDPINGNNVIFNLEDESQGTRRLFNLIPGIIAASYKDIIFIIDEIESSLHPTLTKSIVKLFNDFTSNCKSQLIFSTHSDILLDLELLRQDEIYFFENILKKKLYPLSDFKLRHDTNIRKLFLDGKLGASPKINF